MDEDPDVGPDYWLIGCGILGLAVGLIVIIWGGYTLTDTIHDYLLHRDL